MDLSTVLGGTHTPGIPAATFAMADGMRLRYDQPAAALADAVSAYNVYACDHRQPQIDWFLPAPAMICTFIDAGPVSISVRNNHFGPCPPVMLSGPTSRAFRSTTNGGILVGIGITALGWARLTRRNAADFHNQIVPLAQVGGEALSASIHRALLAAPDDGAVKAALDAVLVPLLSQPHPDEDEIRALMALILDQDMADIGSAAERLGIPTHRLRRLSLRYFGLTPKLLLRRTRFLRSFLRMFRVPGDLGYAELDPAYFDASHFIRDSYTFLGTTPRRFMAQKTPFLDASVRARMAVLGAAAQALHLMPTPSAPPLA